MAHCNLPQEPEEMRELRQEIERLQQENQEITILRQEIKQLKRENQDLKLTLLTAIEHGDIIGEALHQAKQQLKLEARENKQVETSLRALLDLLQRQKTDLEIVIQTLIEHGDSLDQQWNAKATHAEQLAEIDSLTQVANRRKFDHYLNYQWTQMLRQQNSLAVLICDIDYFKQYNDAYGHPIGDNCLRQVAQALQTMLKQGNALVARYGGEEFAVILPQTTVQGAITIANQILSEIDRLQIPHSQSDVSQYLTLSIGLASTIPTHQNSPQDLIDQADRFLYRAKRQGRKQIVYRDDMTDDSYANDYTSDRVGQNLG